MHPTAETHGLGGQEHVLADRRRLAEHEIARLTLQVRERQGIFRREKSALDPGLGAGRPKSEPIVDDVNPALIRGGEALKSSIDELRNQPDQRETDIADRHEERRAGHVGGPQIVPAQRRRAARDGQPTPLQGRAVATVKVERCGSLIRRAGFPHPVGRAGARVHHIDAAVIGEEQGGATAARSARERAAVRRAVGQRTALVPKRHPGEADTGGDQHRLLELAQGRRRVGRFVPVRTFGHFEAEAETPRAPSKQGIEERVFPDRAEQVWRNICRHQSSSQRRRRLNQQAKAG